MKTLFTVEAVSKGGRFGTITNPDGLLDVRLGNPLEKGAETRGLNPELLFGAAYAACYHGALLNAAKKLSKEVPDSTVRAVVSLLEDEQGGYHLGVVLHAAIPGMNRSDLLDLMTVAHETCPYSRALRGDVTVKLLPD
ncbi:MAG TPA: Ohr family peroxiredoxin [Candidatus Limnocylindria bacterium]|jgi:Ohr subfamily peroxiredoxin|nr:Ohr family peroxiredoxin [Candidatus Limnocylindria bacterium]